MSREILLGRRRGLGTIRTWCRSSADSSCMEDTLRLLPAYLGLALIFCCRPASAATYEVASIAQLQARLDRAEAGDTIILRDGAYVANVVIRINRRGTAAAPIRVAAKTVGGVTISGRYGFTISAPAAYVEIVGFVFNNASGSTRIERDATHIRFSQNVFECTGEGSYLRIAGDDAEVDRNEFRNKKTLGNMVVVIGSDGQIAQRVHIHRNYFHDFRKPGGNGAETIRLGGGRLSAEQGFEVIEHNLFVRCNGENELISIKASSNTIRYNTFQDSPGAQVTLRRGNDNLVYANYFLRSGGIRIFGDRHRVFSNYFEGNTGALNIGNGNVANVDARLATYDRPDDNVITFNTLVNNKRNFYMTNRAKGLGATRTLFANNIVVGGGSAADFHGPYIGGVWSGNIVWETNGVGAIPVGTYDLVNPRFRRDALGIYRPQLGSPAINSATDSYTAIVVDIDGQARAGRDRGADEVSAYPSIARVLTVDELLREIRKRR